MLKELLAFCFGYVMGGSGRRKRPLPIVSLALFAYVILAIVVGVVFGAMIVLWIFLGTARFLWMLGRAMFHWSRETFRRVGKKYALSLRVCGE